LTKHKITDSEALCLESKKKQEAFEQQDDEYKIYDYSRTEYDIELSDSTTVFPRQKKLPDAKISIHWEKFAKKKDIIKK